MEGKFAHVQRGFQLSATLESRDFSQTDFYLYNRLQIFPGAFRLSKSETVIFRLVLHTQEYGKHLLEDLLKHACANPRNS